MDSSQWGFELADRLGSSGTGKMTGGHTVTRRTKIQIDQIDRRTDGQRDKQTDKFELLKTACVVNWTV